MNAHRSKNRKRRLAHARGALRRLIRFFIRHPGACASDETLFAAHRALRRAGWSSHRAEWPIEYLTTRGFNPLKPNLP